MNSDDFEEVFKKQVEACDNVMFQKAQEYATEDRLHNFKVAAALQGGTPQSALGGMLAKHIVSIFDLIDQSNDVVIEMEMWDEKIGDALNYLILLKAIMVEEQSTRTTIKDQYA